MTGPLLAGRYRSGGALATALERDKSHWRPADLTQTVGYLAAEASPVSQLLAVAIISAAGPRSGWNPDWRQRLRTIRRSPDPEVATVALAVITSSELG